MEPGLSPGYRHEEEEEGKEGLEEEEEEASPGFVDSWLRRWPGPTVLTEFRLSLSSIKNIKAFQKKKTVSFRLGFS